MHSVEYRKQDISFTFKVSHKNALHNGPQATAVPVYFNYNEIDIQY